MNLKKILITTAGIILTLLITGFFLLIFPFLGTKKVQPGGAFAEGKIFNVVDGITQVFILDGGNRAIGLIDIGDSPCGGPILKILESKGFKASDVKKIFLTHGHRDHIAAAKMFPQAKIYALKEEVEIAEGFKNNPSPMGRIFSPKPTGLKITDILIDGEKIDLGNLKIEAFSIPGHTEGSAAYLVGGVLFLGDAALSSSDGKIIHAVWTFSSNVAQQNRSLKYLADRLAPRKSEIKNIIFSHSGQLEGLQPLTDFASRVNAK